MRRLELEDSYPPDGLCENNKDWQRKLKNIMISKMQPWKTPWLHFNNINFAFVFLLFFHQISDI